MKATSFLVLASALLHVLLGGVAVHAAEPDRPYVELEGVVEEFREVRDWASYYWREDFTFVLCDDAGRRHRIISREPTPWTNLRLGTTYTGLKVDWAKRPRVRVIGVQGVDRVPAEFYDLKLKPGETITTFILRVQASEPGKWQDYYVNNWFHPWGKEADTKVLAHYAADDPHYTIYGYVGGVAAPFDAAGQKLLEKFSPSYGGVIYRARVAKAKNEAGYELRVLHLMGRHKKSAEYEVFHGDAAQLTKLDQRKP